MAQFTYSDWLGHMTTVMQVADPDGVAAFESLAPYFIERGEQLIYFDPEMDFLGIRGVNSSQLTTRSIRTVPLPAQLLTLESINIITPANTLPDAVGAKRIPLDRKTREFIDFVWPIEGEIQAPDPVMGGYYAVFSMNQQPPSPAGENRTNIPSSAIIAPTLDDAYRVEFTGTFRPAPLSALNTTTLLTAYYYPLFLAATLMAGFGYQRDFGQLSSNPQMAVTWRDEYMTLRQLLVAETQRQKAQMGGYSAVAMPMMGRVAQAIAAAPQAAPQAG